MRQNETPQPAALHKLAGAPETGSLNKCLHGDEAPVAPAAAKKICAAGEKFFDFWVFFPYKIGYFTKENTPFLRRRRENFFDFDPIFA